MNEIRLFSYELERLLEYSGSIPTGTEPYKMWRRHEEDQILVGQYYPIETPGQVGIRWFVVAILQGPQPRYGQYFDWRSRCSSGSVI